MFLVLSIGFLISGRKPSAKSDYPLWPIMDFYGSSNKCHNMFCLGWLYLSRTYTSLPFKNSNIADIGLTGSG